jgi:hypothetical protein
MNFFKSAVWGIHEHMADLALGGGLAQWTSHPPHE